MTRGPRANGSADDGKHENQKREERTTEQTYANRDGSITVGTEGYGISIGGMASRRELTDEERAAERRTDRLTRQQRKDLLGVQNDAVIGLLEAHGLPGPVGRIGSRLTPWTTEPV